VSNLLGDLAAAATPTNLGSFGRAAGRRVVPGLGMNRRQSIAAETQSVKKETQQIPQVQAVAEVVDLIEVTQSR
jgi:hypothetical protein